MRGTKRYVSGAWRLQVKDGKKCVTETVHAPKNKTGEKEADAALRRMVDRVEAGHHTSNLTVAELLDRWLQVKASKWQTPRSRQEAERGARRVADRIGTMRLDRLRPIHVDTLYAELEAIPLSKGTVRRTHSTLHAALEQAVRWELIAVNPASKIDPIVVPRRRDTSPTPAQLVRLLAAAADDADFFAYINLASTTGARRGTESALRWSAVDLDAGVVSQNNRFSMSSEGVDEFVGSKSGRRHKVTIGPEVVTALRRWRLEQKERALALGVPLPADPWVFTSPLDPRLPRRPDHWSREWRRLRRRVDPTGGLEHIRLHDLKHYVATQMLDGGMDLMTVAQRLGTSAATILKVYGHAQPANDRAASELMSRVNQAQ